MVTVAVVLIVTVVRHFFTTLIDCRCYCRGGTERGGTYVLNAIAAMQLMKRFRKDVALSLSERFPMGNWLRSEGNSKSNCWGNLVLLPCAFIFIFRVFSCVTPQPSPPSQLPSPSHPNFSCFMLFFTHRKRCMAVLCAQTSESARSKTVARLVSDMNGPQETKKHLALLVVGELGRQTDLSSVKNLQVQYYSWDRRSKYSCCWYWCLDRSRSCAIYQQSNRMAMSPRCQNFRNAFDMHKIGSNRLTRRPNRIVKCCYVYTPWLPWPVIKLSNVGGELLQLSHNRCVVYWTFSDREWWNTFFAGLL